MFCPRCGTENPEEGKFCRKCGTDLKGVSRAIGSDAHTGGDLMTSGVTSDSELAGGDASRYSVSRASRRARHSNDPDDLYAAGIRSAILGFGFLVISAVLFFTNVAGGQSWWWAMLFPGFAMIAGGIGNIAKSKRLEGRAALSGKPETIRQVDGRTAARAIGAAGSDFIPAKESSKFETGDLVPPSVVEGTTRHLQMDTEGETMTLPEIEDKENIG